MNKRTEAGVECLVNIAYPDADDDDFERENLVRALREYTNSILAEAAHAVDAKLVGAVFE